MGLTWAFGWAVAGILIGVASILVPWLPWDAFFDVFDAPLPALAIPGFIGGVTFSLVLGVAGRRRRFDELSLPRFTAWGAVGGLLLSLIPAAMVTAGWATTASGVNLWGLTLAAAVPLTFLCAVSAAGTLVLARRAEDRALMESGADVAGVGLSEKERRELLGPGA